MLKFFNEIEKLYPYIKEIIHQYPYVKTFAQVMGYSILLGEGLRFLLGLLINGEN